MTADDMDHAEPPGKAGEGELTYAKIIAVNFDHDTLFAVERGDGVHVAIKPICDAVGIAWNTQLERLKRDPILAEGTTVMVMPAVGGMQETTCLRLDLVRVWLFTIDESRVKDEETRQKVLIYKRKCHAALVQHFYGRRAEAVDETQESEAPKVRMVTEARHTFGVPAAAQLWVELRLPVVPAMLHTPGPRDLFEFSHAKAT
jgi:P22_AR N-terminal domain